MPGYSQVQLAVKTDIHWLWTRKPSPDPAMLSVQLRDMVSAGFRAARYDVDVPWRTAQWYGIDVPVTLQEVDNCARLVTQITGKKAGRQKERKR